jgi:hypothetical protein
MENILAPPDAKSGGSLVRSLPQEPESNWVLFSQNCIVSYQCLALLSKNIPISSFHRLLCCKTIICAVFLINSWIVAVK